MYRDTTNASAQDTTSGASPRSDSSGASGALRSGLRGISFADQIQMLTPAGGPRRPVQREVATTSAAPIDEAAAPIDETAAPIDEAAAPAAADEQAISASPLELLTNAWNEGVAAFDSAVASLSTEQLVQALPSVQEGLDWLLDKFWPSGSGWSAAFAIAGGGTLAGSDGGIPCDLEVEGEGSVKVMLTRSGGEVELAVEVEGEVGGEGQASIKLAKLPVGMNIAGAAGFKLTVDLGAVDWPTGAWDKLKSGDLQGAFGEVFRGALSLATNTQVEVELAGTGKGSIGGEAGVEDVLKAKAQVGLQAGLAVTVSNATESKEGELLLSGSVGCYAAADLESIEPGTLQAVSDLVAFLLGADFGKVGDTGLEVGAAVGLELGLTYPKLGTLPYLASPVVRLFAQVDGALTILGSGLEEGSAKVSLPLALPDIPGFIAAVKQGQAAGGAVALLPASGIEAEVEGTICFGALARLLGVSAKSVFGLDQESAIGDDADVSCALEMALTRDELAAMVQSVAERAEQVAKALSQGDLLGAFSAYIDTVSGGLAEAGAGFINAIKKFELTLEIGTDREYGGGTPFAGTITGVTGSVEGSVSSVYKADFTPGKVAPADVEKVLREIL